MIFGSKNVEQKTKQAEIRITDEVSKTDADIDMQGTSAIGYLKPVAGGKGAVGGSMRASVVSKLSTVIIGTKGVNFEKY